MARISNFGRVDALESGEIAMPLVILKKESCSRTKYVGFIPGMTSKDIISEDVDTCKKFLKTEAKNIIKQMAKNNLAFPFFPAREEIVKDYPNVMEISFIKIKSEKRQNQN